MTTAVLVLVPKGYSIIVEEESTAQKLKEYIERKAGVQPDMVGVIQVSVDGNEEYVVEFRVDAEKNTEELRSKIPQRFTIENIRPGLHIQSVKDITATVTQQISSNFNLDPDSLTIDYVNPSSEEPARAIVQFQDISRKEITDQIELKATFPEAKNQPVLFNASHIQSLGKFKMAEGVPWMEVTISPNGRDHMREVIQDLGLVNDPDKYRFTISVSGEKIASLGVTEDLVSKISNGNWDGIVSIPFSSVKERATVLQQSIGVELEAPVRSRMNLC